MYIQARTVSGPIDDLVGRRKAGQSLHVESPSADQRQGSREHVNLGGHLQTTKNGPISLTCLPTILSWKGPPSLRISQLRVLLLVGS